MHKFHIPHIPQILQIYTEQKFSQEVSRIRMILVLSSYSGGQKALEHGFPIPTQNSIHNQPINQDIFTPTKFKNFFFLLRKVPEAVHFQTIAATMSKVGVWLQGMYPAKGICEIKETEIQSRSKGEGNPRVPAVQEVQGKPVQIPIGQSDPGTLPSGGSNRWKT